MLKILSLLCASLFLSACATPHHLPQQVVRKADYVVLEKSGRTITLWSEGQMLAHYPVMALGPNPQGHKQYEGDGRTPEGLYLIDEKHESDNFQKFLRISYPNKEDKARAKASGLKPGGFVGIHGDKGGVAGFFDRMKPNWTQGCITVRNDAVNDIYARVEVGTPILIRP